MIVSIVKIITRCITQFIFWVFVLSIQWNDRSLFDHAHEIIIDNELIELVDQQLAEGWEQVKKIAISTMDKKSPIPTESSLR